MKKSKRCKRESKFKYDVGIFALRNLGPWTLVTEEETVVLRENFCGTVLEKCRLEVRSWCCVFYWRRKMVRQYDVLVDRLPLTKVVHGPWMPSGSFAGYAVHLAAKMMLNVQEEFFEL